MLIACLKLLLFFLFLVSAAPIQVLAIVLKPSWAGLLPLFIHRLFVKLFSLRIHHRGCSPDKGIPVLILANHVSWLDIPVLGAARPLSFIAKAEIARWPVIGLFARLQRTLFIDRSRKTATAQVNKAISHRLVQGDAIVLFAEGTTGDGVRMLPFRSSLIGAANAVLEQGGLDSILIQPVALCYHHRNGMALTRRERPLIAWYGDMNLANSLKAFLTQGPIDVSLIWGESFSFNGTSNRKVAASSAEIEIKKALNGTFLSQGH